MTSVREILIAIEKLPADEFLKLQARMDRIAERIWETEHRRATARSRKAGLTDEHIDQFVMRRRYKGRRARKRCLIRCSGSLI
jgi:hypothetical protein